MIEISKEGSSTKMALGLHLESLVRIFSIREPIHLWISWPINEEVIIQATGIAFRDESKTSKVHRGYCQVKKGERERGARCGRLLSQSLSSAINMKIAS